MNNDFKNSSKTITEEKELNGAMFIHNYSDAGFYIRKTGTDEIYSDAYDPIRFRDERKYEETDQKIETEEIR